MNTNFDFEKSQKKKIKKDVKTKEILKTTTYFLILELFVGIQYEEANQNKNDKLDSNLSTTI